MIGDFAPAAPYDPASRKAFTTEARQKVNHPITLPERATRLINQYYARLSTRLRPATGFTYQPEPRSIGLSSSGQQLLAGNFLFAGHLIEAPDAMIWDLPAPSRSFAEELHGFSWLDDLAAVGDREAARIAQAWTFEWISRYGRGRGPGWSPDLTGRRLIRWINHSIFLLNGQPPEASKSFFRSLGQQTIFLARRWRGARPGLPRFEALCGLIYAGLALMGMERHVEQAMSALARECERQIDPKGGIPTRNPEELLEVLTYLIWAASALSSSGRMAPAEHLAAIERIAPTLRALRHGDGGLARFHGGDAGLPGRLDHALAASGVRGRIEAGLPMGYARLHGGRTTVIADAAPPPKGRASLSAHASTLAFELTSGRRPLIVSCGPGRNFGEGWHRAGRATASHSTVAIEGVSSARLGAGRREGELLGGPSHVPVRQAAGPEGSSLHAAHDGYVATHGLTHARKLRLSPDGAALAGSDTLATTTDADKRRFDAAMDSAGLQGIAASLRFHLHPDVDAAMDLGGKAVSLALRSGEIWVFRYRGRAELSLEPGVYLEKGRLKPRATKQIVLSWRLFDYASRINWSLSKAQDGPGIVRDLEAEDGMTIS